MDTEFDADQLPPVVESIRSGRLLTYGSAATIVSRVSHPCVFFQYNTDVSFAHLLIVWPLGCGSSFTRGFLQGRQELQKSAIRSARSCSYPFLCCHYSQYQCDH